MRTTLIDAALTVLQRDGAAALTVRNITAEAGCSTTGVYTYFGGKHGLVEEIFHNGFVAFDAELDPYLEVGDLVGAGHAYRRFALAHPTQYMVMFGRAVPDFIPSPAALERAMLSFAKLTDGVRRAGLDRPEQRALHLFATVHGYMMLEMAGMAPPTDEPFDVSYGRALDAAAR
jgi:AcrR family transcriptional regulator